MKSLKKIASLLLALVMALALTTTAFAADLGTGSGRITIENATVEETYHIYKIFDTDSTGKGNITATETQKGWFEEQTDNPFDFTKNSAGTYNVSVREGTSEAAVIKFLQSFVTKDENGPVTVNTDFLNNVVVGDRGETATSATLTFENIPYGYYLVTSSMGAVVTVDSTDSDAKVVDKNQLPNWNEGSKKITQINGESVEATEVSANFGDTITYQLQYTASNYKLDKKITKYVITDNLGTGLSYVLNNNTVDLSVTVEGKAISNYSIIYADNKFVLTIPWVDDNGNSIYTSPVDVTVTYKATVTSEADIAGDGNSNKAVLDYYYVVGDDEPYERMNESKTTVYTYALGFHKVDKDDNRISLSGAEFTVALKTENPDYDLNDTTSSRYIYKPIGAVDNKDGTYSYTTNANADGYTTAFVSNENGLVVIKGLAAGVYTVTETKAPAGYNVLTDSVDVEAVMDSETIYTSTTTTYYDKDGNVVNEETEDGQTVVTDYGVNVVKLLVENDKGTELPTTGGTGTTLFYVIGGILVAGAVILLVTRRRMNSEK